jgi:hypothetical protein
MQIFNATQQCNALLQQRWSDHLNPDLCCSLRQWPHQQNGQPQAAGAACQRHRMEPVNKPRNPALSGKHAWQLPGLQPGIKLPFPSRQAGKCRRIGNVYQRDLQEQASSQQAKHRSRSAGQVAEGQ